MLAVIYVLREKWIESNILWNIYKKIYNCTFKTVGWARAIKISCKDDPQSLKLLSAPLEEMFQKQNWQGGENELKFMMIL